MTEDLESICCVMKVIPLMISDIKTKEFHFSTEERKKCLRYDSLCLGIAMNKTETNFDNSLKIIIELKGKHGARGRQEGPAGTGSTRGNKALIKPFIDEAQYKGLFIREWVHQTTYFSFLITKVTGSPCYIRLLLFSLQPSTSDTSRS